MNDKEIDYKALMSEIGKIRAQYVAEGATLSDASKWAAHDVAMTHGYMSGHTLMQAIGHAMGKLGKGKRRANGEKSKTPSIALYEQWIGQNDFVPADAVLAHFSGCSVSAFANARSILRKRGYVLEMHGYGWKVTGRPVEETRLVVTQSDDTRKQLAVLLRQAADLAEKV